MVSIARLAASVLYKIYEIGWTAHSKCAEIINMSLLTPASSPTFSPLYRQVIGLILRSLESGEWRPGDAIPSESTLAVRFGVSQGTVRKAIDEMAADKLLVRRQGKGTFVATHRDPQTFSRFLRIAANAGTLAPLKSAPLGCWRAKASADVANALKIDPGTQVVILRRLVLAGEEPAIFDEIYLPGDLFSDLSIDLLKSGEVSLYSLYENHFGVRVIRADERLRAISADSVSAESLRVAEGQPLLLVERVTYTYADRPVEWRRGVFCSEHFHYQNELS